jgi:cyclomaltodextrinase / maltogenic alpha-amylase / neopullulanase
MWFNDAFFYQIYPLGSCGAPAENSWDWSVWNGAAQPVNRISRISGWIPHLKRLGVNAVYFSPVFQSDSHGYDTRDYYTIDSRLGSNEDFATVCRALHDAGIKVVLDGVFNHTGRGFWAFRDVQEHRQQSAYKDWFHIDWSRNSDRNDGFWYEGWEGHYDLVKLNLENPAVQEHIFGAIRKWSDLFGIDGIRLDVAYSLPEWFIQKLRAYTDSLGREKGQEFVLIGELIRDLYAQFIGPDKLHSCTGYECYKGIYSSLNDINFFEIAYSLNRLYGNNGICRNMNLFNFVDNHDVERIASILKNPAHIPLAYGLLFAIPGTPCVYYGSEWGIHGKKQDGDNALRPAIEHPEWTALTDNMADFARVRQENSALRGGTYRQLFLTNGQFIFSRNTPGTEVIVALNASGSPYTVNPCGQSYARFDGLYGTYRNLLTGGISRYNGSVSLLPESILYLSRTGS